MSGHPRGSEQSPGKPIRVAIVAPGLAHYRIPLLNRLHALPQVQVTALLGETPQALSGEQGDAPRYANSLYFRSFTLLYQAKSGDRLGLTFSLSLFWHLLRTEYDVLIALGWTMPITALALLAGKLTGKRVVVWDESIPHAANASKRALAPLIRWYIGAFDAYLAASSWCIEYLVSIGAARERCVLFPQVTDNEFFARGADEYRQERDKTRRELGISTRLVILFVGQFIVRKGIEPLLSAFEQLAQEHLDVSLMLVGQGNLKADMEARRDQSAVGDRILIRDFASQQELPKFYAAADVFVLPSYYDTFGVVVDEAMASGLPVVTTNRVGAVADLVRDGVNGRIVPSGDVNALEHALEQLIQDAALRQQMGENAQQRMKTWSVDQAAQGLLKCINIVLGTRGTAHPAPHNEA